ncbi:MAG: ABC transporter ATP-binding protein [Bacilli bacterium]|jgi:ABC-type multidrug transport system fused ATPase/permease subunit|nr:ABC transporter ATP-binding protein [Bacilli bacterium]
MEKNKKEERKQVKINLKRTWNYIKLAKGNLVYYVVVSIIEAIISILLPIVSAKIILNMTDGLFLQLILTGLVVLFLHSIVRLISFFKTVFYKRIFNVTIEAMKMDLTKAILDLEIRELDNSNSGLFINRINKDTEDIAGVFMEFAYWISYIISNMGVLVTIFILNKYMFVFSLITTLTCYFIHRKKVNKMYKIQKKLRSLSEDVTSLSTEVIRGIRDIKVLNASDVVLSSMGKRINDVLDERSKLINNRNLFDILDSIVKNVFSFLFLVLGVYLCSKNLLTIPVFVILYNYLNKVYGLLNGIANLSEYLKTFALSSSRIYEIIYNEEFKKEEFGDKHIDKIIGNIEFKNVSFEYNDNVSVLKKLNLKIKENETVAIVGKSGAGKTTLFSLMSYLYKPTKGKILIDGIDISKLDRGSIRDNISIITQNPYIFNFSIKENLLLTSPDATDDEIKNACKIASLDEFIETLPDGYDTVVGEGGVTLSGGQRQRLAIARALLMKTKIILFDEATSALDNDTQANIQESIKHMKGDFTIVIVAHRLSTIKDADRILVLDDGAIVQEGTHKQLMKSSTLYKNLYKKENNE